MRDIGQREGSDVDDNPYSGDRQAGLPMGSRGGLKDENGAQAFNGAGIKDSTLSPSSSFTFTFPSSSSSSATTPTRRRAAPPGMISNFPSATVPRNPPSQTPFFPSPSRSPKPQSHFRSPETPPNVRQPFLPITLPQSLVSPSSLHGSSPWQALAATSGAPTPSIEAGPGVSRSSPHLGNPFEKLNIGGSWSGANLLGEGQGRRGSLDAEQLLGTSPGKRSPHPSHKATTLPTPGGMSAETLAKYRAMAGKAPPIKKPKEQGLAMEGIEMGPSTSVSKPTLPASLAERRVSLPKNSLNASSSHVTKSPSPVASNSSMSPSPGPPNLSLQALSASALRPLISNPSTLILDLRPPSAFHALHLPSAHTLSIPSTLLRRSAFTLEKLTQMLTPPSNEDVAKWRDMTDIILIDSESTTAPEGSVLQGLAGKFDREGFGGKLWFVKGGQKAVQATGGLKFSSENGEEETQVTPTSTGPGGLKIGRLGKLAFQHESTGSGRKSRTLPNMKLNLSEPGLALRPDSIAQSSAPTTSIRGIDPRSKFQIGPQTSTNGAMSPEVRLQPANPFFDNIRQNLELSHGGITERISLALAPDVVQRVAELPAWLGNLVKLPDKECSERLADQFYRLELGEQKRLQTVMDVHSKGSGAAWVQLKHETDEHNEAAAEQRAKDVAELERLAAWGAGTQALEEHYFPFSITAGVERGSKNRYKNIWPYDFSRVRLDSPADDDSDYINASFVQPRGTGRRYIATQGPLDATYRDFWTLVWEQDVRVIVMLTKQYEGGLIKCGNYWEEEKYGSLRLRLVSQSGGEDHRPQATTGFDFGAAALPPTATQEPVGNIRRVFQLSHIDRQEATRQVVQIQCTAWPDFDVPDTPDVLLNLMHDVDGACEELCGVNRDDRLHQPPVLVHCSAGVGRTGSYIIADAVVDGMRRERRTSNPTPTPYPPSPSKSILSTQLRSHRSSPSAISLGGRTGGSVDSVKSVSFLSPFPTPSAGSPATTFSTSPGVISMSAMPETTPMPGVNNPSATSYLDSKVGVAPEEKMELDPPVELHQGLDDVQGGPRGDRFTKHRGSIAASVDSEDGRSRRPSLASPHTSSENLSLAEFKEWKDPQPVTRSSADPRTPARISDMENPIAFVLEGMRVQRMSLVQSLRQYLFVHRVVIQSYLVLIDEERSRRAKSESAEAEGTGSRQGPSFKLKSSSVDDECHPKRRASPTDLQPMTEEEAALVRGGGLSKRPSVKRMRAGVEGHLNPAAAAGAKTST